MDENDSQILSRGASAGDSWAGASRRRPGGHLLDPRNLPGWLTQLGESVRRSQQSANPWRRRATIPDPVTTVQDLVRPPVVIGVLADLSGAGRRTPRDGSEFHFREVTPATFDDFMRACRPRMQFVAGRTGAGETSSHRSADGWPVDLAFDSLGDFAPPAVARGLPPFRHFLQKRCAMLAAEGTGSGDRLMEFDCRLSAELSMVLHHPEFQALEGSWRGLHRLVSSVGANPRVRVQVMDVSWEELVRNGTRHRHWDSWHRDPLLRHLRPSPLGSFGGYPFSFLIGDYEFGHGPESVQVLRHLSRVCALAHAPLLTGASPKLLGLREWGQLGSAILDSAWLQSQAEYCAWNSLREEPDAASVVLAVGRVLAREPYRPERRDSAECAGAGFNFAEDLGAPGEGDLRRLPWSNTAYAMGTLVARLLLPGGRCEQPDPSGAQSVVPRWPSYRWETPGGGTLQVGPCEIRATPAQRAECNALGLAVLELPEGEMRITPAGISTMHRSRPIGRAPSDRLGPASSGNLGRTLMGAYFARGTAALLREWRQLGWPHPELAGLLRHWLDEHVLNDLDGATDEMRVQRPLRSAWIDFDGMSRGRLLLYPHGLEFDPSVPIRVVVYT